MKKSCLFVLSAMLLAGCVKSEVEYTKRYGFGFADRKNYKKLKDYKLSLDLSSGSREFNAGKPGELIFVLRNDGKNTVKIHEWFKFDPNNLQVRCQIWVPGSDRPERDLWLDVSAPVKKPIWRYPLTIEPGASVFVSTRLDFLKNLIVTPGSERRYFIQGKLNLKSVDVESPVRSISVRPGVLPKISGDVKRKKQ